MCQKIIAILKQPQKIIAKLNKTIIHEYPPLQEKSIMPNAEVQEVVADEGVYGLSKVSVGRIAMQEKEVTPSTEIQNILPDEGYVGLSKVNVAGVSTGQITDVQYLFYNNCRKDEIADVVKCCKNVTSCERMFYGSSLLQNANLRDFDMSQVTTTWNMFYNCNALRYIYFDKEIKDKIEVVGYMFSGCKSLQSIDLSSFDFSNVIDLRNMFNSCSAVTSIKFFTNLGKGFKVTMSAYTNYTFNISACTKLPYESLIDLLTNGLYDLNLTYDVANGGTLYRQSCVIGPTNKAKLQATEEGLAALAEADRKGWDVS